jgi:hypothetical protein
MEHALLCPQCNAPLPPHRFARSITCPYCGTTVQLDETSISAATFHEAFKSWNSPAAYQAQSLVSIGDRHWSLDKLIAHGEIADVYSGCCARWPTELVIIKILRDSQNAELLDNEWDTLEALIRSDAPGADTFTQLIPQPVLHSNITGGAFTGQRANIFRWESGFHHSFEEVRRVYPQGVQPRASIWIWRRILEVLSFIHASGMVHAAVTSDHLLVQENEHGVRLIGYTRAGRIGNKLSNRPPSSDSFYPQFAKSERVLTTHLDIVMSARCVIAILGGDPETASLPKAVPAKLVNILQKTALSQPGATPKLDAWAIREELGRIAKEIFGPPEFIPIVMPA